MSASTDAKALDTHIRALERGFSREYRRELRALPNVRGTGVGLREVGGKRLQEAAITVYVSDKVPLEDLEPDERVPDYLVIDGERVLTDVRLAGEFRANAGSWARGERVRPIIGGLEVGARKSEAVGTVSGLFRTRSGQPRLLMSRHVISEAESGPTGRIVLQPRDGKRFGSLADTHDFHVDDGTRANGLDTALIEPDDVDATSGVYLGWLSASDTGRASIGDRVMVFSASRGIAAGEVITRGVFSSLELPSGDTAEYGGLIEYDVPSEAGSSGAMVGMLDPETRELTIVGQHVGGTAGSSLMIPWVRIEREFGELTPEDAYSIGTGGSGVPAPDPSPDPQPATVDIFTEDDGGDFVGNATVTVDGTTYQTDSVGERTIELEPGTYEIAASKDGYESDTKQITVDWDEQVSVTLTLSYIREQAEVTFRTRDSNGDPINADLTVSWDDGLLAGVSTGSDGNYSYEFDQGTYEITVEAGGYVTETRTEQFEWGETRTLTFTLALREDPTMVDVFDRTDISPWENTHEEYQTDPANHAVEIVDASWAENGRALHVPPAASAVVTSGLPNFPEAGRGPGSDGAWEAQIRMDEYGGSLDQVRLEWAYDGNEFLRWHIEDGGISVREGTNWQFQFGVNTSVGDIRILRVNEWQPNGYIDCSVHDGNGSEFDRISSTLDSGSSAPDSGGLRVWTNYTTGFSVNYVRLLD